MKRSLAFAAILSSLFASPALAQGPSPSAAAGDTQRPSGGEADSHFRRGVELYKESDYAAALIEFRRAYEIDPKYQALYNIGETYFQLNDYASALKSLERYLKDGGAQVSSGRREEVQKEIDKLKTRVATLEVSTNVPDVELFIDDISVGKTPLSAPLQVSAGRRKLTASRPGKPPLTQIVELAGGDAEKLSLSLSDDGGGAAPAPASRVPVAPWVVTGVLAAGAIVTGALALSASSNLKNKLAETPANAGDISSAHSKTFGLALTTDVLIGAAIVVGGVSIYFTAAASKADKASPPPSQGTVARAPRVAWSSPFSSQPPAGSARFVRIEAGPESARISGSF